MPRVNNEKPSRYDRIRDLAAQAAALLQTAHSGGVALGKALLLLSNVERVLCRFAEARAAAEAARATFAPSGDPYYSVQAYGAPVLADAWAGAA